MGYESANCITEMCRESMQLAHWACLLYYEHETGPFLMNKLTEIRVRELRSMVSSRYSEVWFSRTCKLYHCHSIIRHHSMYSIFRYAITHSCSNLHLNPLNQHPSASIVRWWLQHAKSMLKMKLLPWKFLNPEGLVPKVIGPSRFQGIVYTHR